MKNEGKEGTKEKMERGENRREKKEEMRGRSKQTEQISRNYLYMGHMKECRGRRDINRIHHIDHIDRSSLCRTMTDENAYELTDQY